MGMGVMQKMMKYCQQEVTIHVVLYLNEFKRRIDDLGAYS